MTEADGARRLRSADLEQLKGRGRTGTIFSLRGLSRVAPASHLRYIAGMKTSTLPPLRVEPRLRSLAERLLREGETLSSFVVDAVEERVRSRAIEDEFIKRGLASGEKARRSGKYVSATSVVAGLRRRLDRARRAAAGKAGEKRPRAR